MKQQQQHHRHQALNSMDGYAFVQTWLDARERTSIPWPTIYEVAKQKGHFRSLSTWRSVKYGYYRWNKGHYYHHNHSHTYHQHIVIAVLIPFLILLTIQTF